MFKRINTITYVSTSTKTIGSGKKVKYEDQKKFLIEAIVTGWETGNHLSKSALFCNLLICQFGHEKEED